MMNSRMRSCVLTVLLGVACGSVSAAQGNSTNTIKSCSEAARFVENGRPAHKQVAALEYLENCGQTGATATAFALRQSGSEIDVKTLGVLYQSIDWWRDATIMNAAMELARDPGASVPARVFAMSHLLSLKNPGFIYGYDAMLEGPTSHHVPCVRGSVSYPRTLVGQPLPSDFVTQIEVVFRQIVADDSAPREVRNAAACIDF